MALCMYMSLLVYEHTMCPAVRLERWSLYGPQFADIYVEGQRVTKQRPNYSNGQSLESLFSLPL